MPGGTYLVTPGGVVAGGLAVRAGSALLRGRRALRGRLLLSAPVGPPALTFGVTATLVLCASILGAIAGECVLGSAP